MIKINTGIKPSDLNNKLKRFWDLSGEKIKLIEKNYDVSKGSPVFTMKGIYTTRGWTEWTQGFQYGSAILQYDATGEKSFLELGRKKTVEVMAPHVSNSGVHDHGFNNVSTYGRFLAQFRPAAGQKLKMEVSFTPSTGVIHFLLILSVPVGPLFSVIALAIFFSLKAMSRSVCWVVPFNI